MKDDDPIYADLGRLNEIVILLKEVKKLGGKIINYKNKVMVGFPINDTDVLHKWVPIEEVLEDE